METRKLPIGIDSFEKIRTEGFYYVDKTSFIHALLQSWSEVNLFTRPRRFGKTLTLKMLKAFFEIGGDPSLFDGLAIIQDKDLCERYMGRLPVVFVSFKGVDGLDYDQAYSMLASIIREEALRFQFLLSSENLSDHDKQELRTLFEHQIQSSSIMNGLRVLTKLLHKHYGQKPILLIDEYDVPLDKAFHHGYYNEMVSLIRGMFGQALKTNDNLYFAVLTGCLRVSKESIFTGLNNLMVHTITDIEFDEYFGFTDSDVKKLLSDYHLLDYYDITKEWYDGYRFGNTDVYCPWDVINYCRALRVSTDAKPQAYWLNTSGNDLVRRFIRRAGPTTRETIERLVANEVIVQKVKQELTYSEIDASIDNLWSILFVTGYLTYKGTTEDGRYKLRIPNREIRDIYIEQIQEWFQEQNASDPENMTRLFSSLLTGNASGIETSLNDLLENVISIFDTSAPTGKKENFYHGLLLGLLSGDRSWFVISNTESGDGLSDIMGRQKNFGFVIEVKYAADYSSLPHACEQAMRQIEEKRYTERLRLDGLTNIWTYGIAFYKKRCMVIAKQVDALGTL